MPSLKSEDPGGILRAGWQVVRDGIVTSPAPGLLSSFCDDQIMYAEIISIGDELTSGQRLDTNSQWLSRQLGELGIRVMLHTTIADDMQTNIAAFQQAFERVDLIICTGGLGPTADDLTRQAVADAAGLPLVQDQAALEHIQQLFRQRRRPMPEQNVVQSMFPEGSRVVHNPHGSAPGIDLTLSRRDGKPVRLFALPGVPAEMKEMWDQTVRPDIISMLPGPPRVIVHQQVKCFGVGESDLEQMLPDLIRRDREPRVGITVSKATITLRVTAEGDSQEECIAAMQPTIASIHECLGSLVFGSGEEELQDAIARLLEEKRATLFIIELGTRGLLNQWMGELNELQGRYLGGAVLSSLEQAGSLPGMNGDLPLLVDQSPEAALKELANSVRQATQADYLLVAGPIWAKSGKPDKPAIDLVVATANGTEHQRAAYGGHPDIRQSRSAKQALDFLRLQMLEARV